MTSHNVTSQFIIYGLDGSNIINGFNVRYKTYNVTDKDVLNDPAGISVCNGY